MNENHTPGPWRVEFDENGGYDCTMSGFMVMAPDIFRQICTVEVLSWRIDGVADYDACHSHNASAAADAHLIAAAPELLAACQTFLEVWDRTGQIVKTDVAVRMMRVAIDKARGEALE